MSRTDLEDCYQPGCIFSKDKSSHSTCYHLRLNLIETRKLLVELSREYKKLKEENDRPRDKNPR